MADIYIIRGSQVAMALTVVVHMDTPVGNNAVGVAWATALTRSGISKASVLPSGDDTGGTIGAAEASAVSAGTRFEFTDICPLPEVWDSLTLAQKQNFVRNWRTTRVAAKSAELAQLLNYYGLAFT